VPGNHVEEVDTWYFKYRTHTASRKEKKIQKKIQKERNMPPKRRRVVATGTNTPRNAVGSSAAAAGGARYAWS